MKSIIPILAVLLCLAGVSLAASPDIPAAVGEIKQAKVELAGAKMALHTLADEFIHIISDKAADDQFKTAQADQIAKLQKQISADKAAHIRELCWGMGAVNGLLEIAAIAAAVTGLYAIAIRCGIIGAIGTTLTLGIAFYAPALAIYGVLLMVVVATGGMLYLVWQVYQHKTAAVDLSSIPTQLKNAGVIAGDALSKAEAIAKEAMGPLAAKISKQNAVSGATQA